MDMSLRQGKGLDHPSRSLPATFSIISIIFFQYETNEKTQEKRTKNYCCSFIAGFHSSDDYPGKYTDPLWYYNTEYLKVHILASSR